MMRKPRHSAYTVSLQERYIDVVWDGYISREMAVASNKAVYEAARSLQNQGKEVLVCIHTPHVPLFPNTDAFAEALKLLKTDIRFLRVVIWGPMPHMVRLLVATLVGAYKNEPSIRYIRDHDQALAWLLGGS